MKNPSPASAALLAAAACVLLLSSCAAPKAAKTGGAPEISDPGRTVCAGCGRTYIVTQE